MKIHTAFVGMTGLGEAIEKAQGGEEARAAIEAIGKNAARTAAQMTPRRRDPKAHTHPVGAGAASVHSEVVKVRGKWQARVGPDAAHARYLRYPHEGTRYIRAQHFLVHAAQVFARQWGARFYQRKVDR